MDLSLYTWIWNDIIKMNMIIVAILALRYHSNCSLIMAILLKCAAQGK